MKKTIVSASFILAIVSSQTLSAVSLNSDTIEKASADMSEAQSWDCGPRAVSMALAMLDAKPSDVNTFVNSSPRSFGSSPQCEKTKRIQAAVVAMLPYAKSIFRTEVGPYAECLVEHAQASQNVFDVTHGKSSDFESVLSMIESDLAQNVPVIAKTQRGLFLHYSLIVKLDRESETVTILESENRNEKTVSFTQLEEMMNLDNYNEFLYGKVSMFGMGGIMLTDDVSSILSGYSLVRFQQRQIVVDL